VHARVAEVSREETTEVTAPRSTRRSSRGTRGRRVTPWLPSASAAVGSSSEATLHISSRRQGGLGYNTAIEDAVNLGWKLAAVIKRSGAPGLLRSYELERRPAAVRNTGYARDFAGWPGAAPLAPGRPLALRHVRLRVDAPTTGSLSADGRPPDSRRRTAGRRSRSRRGGRSRGAGALRGPAGASSGQIRWSPGAGSTTGTQRRSCRSSRGVPHPPDHASVHPSTPSTGPCRSTSSARRRLSARSASTRGLADVLVRVD
jgi:hypothetical protein